MPPKKLHLRGRVLLTAFAAKQLSLLFN